MRVQATRARDAVERAEMEEFFMRCVEVRAISWRDFLRMSLAVLKRCDDTHDVVTI